MPFEASTGMDDHEHEWTPGTAQKLTLPAVWYWIKGCTCGAILMLPVPKDLHVVMEILEGPVKDPVKRDAQN